MRVRVRARVRARVMVRVRVRVRVRIGPLLLTTYLEQIDLMEEGGAQALRLTGVRDRVPG